MFSIKKSFINTILGITGAFITSVFQFLLIYFVIKFYGSKMNGLIRTIMAITSSLAIAESGLGIMAIIYLYRPLIKNDWDTTNDVINTVKDNYRKMGLLYLGLVVIIGLLASFILTLQTIDSPVKIEDVSHASKESIQVPFWQLWIIIISLSLKNIIAFFWVGAYENLLQADDRNYLRRIISLFTDLFVFLFVVLAMWKQVQYQSYSPYIPFLIYIAHGIIKSIFIYIFVKIKYPWLRSKNWLKNNKLIQDSNYVAFKGYAESILNNIDFVLIVILLGFRVTSAYSIYMTVAIGIRTMMLVFISSFKDFFGTYIAQQGRVKWDTYNKFALYGYILSGILFIVQFIISPYLVNGLYGQLREQIIPPYNTDSIFNIKIETQAIEAILNKPHFSLIFALSSTLLMLGEPGNVLISGAGRYRETTKHTYIMVIINIVISLFLGIIFRFGVKSGEATIYSILSGTIIVLIYRLIYINIYISKYLTYNSNYDLIWKDIIIIVLPMTLAIIFAYLGLFNNEFYQFKKYETLSSNLGLSGIIKLFFSTLFIALTFIIFLSLILKPKSLLSIAMRIKFIKWFLSKIKTSTSNIIEADGLEEFTNKAELKVKFFHEEEKRNKKLDKKKNISDEQYKNEVYILKESEL